MKSNILDNAATITKEPGYKQVSNPTEAPQNAHNSQEHKMSVTDKCRGDPTRHQTLEAIKIETAKENTLIYNGQD